MILIEYFTPEKACYIAPISQMKSMEAIIRPLQHLMRNFQDYSEMFIVEDPTLLFYRRCEICIPNYIPTSFDLTPEGPDGPDHPYERISIEHAHFTPYNRFRVAIVNDTITDCKYLYDCRDYAAEGRKCKGRNFNLIAVNEPRVRL